MRLLVAGAVTMLAAVPVGTARADSAPSVTFTRDVQVVPLDAGWLVTVACNATADPGTTQQVPTATAVGCSLDDVSKTRAMPGHESFVTVSAATTHGLTFCIWGEAAFVDPVSGSALMAERGPECEALTF